MINLNRAIEIYESYSEKRIALDRLFFDKLEKTKDFTDEKAYEISTKILEEFRSLKNDMRSDTEAAFLTLEKEVESYLFSKFTMTLSAEDAANLDNLAKCELTNAEWDLQFEKYKKNPLALRRLKNLLKDNSFVKVNKTTVNDYDFYSAAYQDIWNLAKLGINALDGDIPRNVDSDKEISNITIELYINALKARVSEVINQFNALEGNQ